MTDRHEKWVKVDPGTVIPAGQPYRFENGEGFAFENLGSGLRSGTAGEWFVDSSWKPPLVLPTARSLILAEVDDRYTEDKVLLTGPHTDKGNTWWSFDTRLSLIPDDINSFEVLWTEDR